MADSTATDFDKGWKFIEECAQLEPSDIYKYTQWIMAGMHAALFRGLKSIEDQLDNDHSGDMKNWIGYIMSFTNTLVGHHKGEEESLFPIFEKEIDMKESVEQHHSFLPQIEAFDAYLKECLVDESKFSAIKVRNHIAQFKLPMMQHLTDELHTLDPEKLKAKATPKVLEDADKAHQAWLQSNADPFINLVFILTHNASGEHDWPRLPFVPGKILVPYVFRWRYNGYWKYAPHAINAI